jgi:ribonucleoside-diphosphate reductase alpha chain
MREKYLGIEIDRERNLLFDSLGIKRMKESYMRDEEDCPQERFAYVANAFGSNKDHAQRMYEYMSKQWFSASTPILSFGRAKKGLPISCYLSYLPDTSEGLVDTLSEVNWLSMLGGGVGIGLGIRSSDDKSTGIMPHMKTYDASCLAYRQGRTRRGSYAMYLDISHPDIIPFLEMRKPTGDPNQRCLNLHHGVNITDDFMQIIENCMKNPKTDDSWALIDPASKVAKEVVSAKYLWQKIIELRMMTGEPYIHFIDTSNREMPKFLKEKGLSIKQSNLCAEVILPVSEVRTAVCCLSSVNIDYYDEWSKDSQFFLDIAEFMDNVLDCFIQRAPDEISRAKFSAMRERSIGIGELGFHSYLQSKMIPFESLAAKICNKQIIKHIRTEMDKANLELGKKRGEAPDAAGTGFRFSHVMAIAPNATTSIIMGNTSPSIEPYRANAYRQDTLSGSYMNKNKHLEKLLKEKVGDDTQEIWSSIIANNGSVQHLKELTDEEKEVFKTAIEIDQRWVIEHAADRQKFIDQGQSLNLFFKPDESIKYLHTVHFMAWKLGLKTLYYCRSESIRKADKVSQKIERKRIEDIDMNQVANGEGCLACEG